MKITLKKLLVPIICIIGNQALSQTFAETMGTVSSTTSISSHESNNGFLNAGLLMSGTSDVRNTAASSGYIGASGGANIFFTSSGNPSFLISSINTSNLSGISLSFGCLKSTTSSNGSDFLVECSSDGINYQALSFTSFPTGTGTAVWRLVTVSGNIPSVSNLRLRFRNTGTSTQYRIDDIKLDGQTTLPTCTASINTEGGVNYICVGQSLQLTANAATGYAWSTGASTPSINVNTPGTYSVQVTNAQGCVSTASITLSQAPVINTTMTSSVLNATLCASGGNAATTLTATVIGGTSLNYSWQYQDNFGNYQTIISSAGTSPLTTSQNASPSTTRNYRLKIIDPSFPSCSYYATQLVTVIPDPVIQLSVTDPSCFGSNDGTITANITGGTVNNSYLFSLVNSNSTSSVSNQISGLAAGNYTLNINGSHGCNATQSATINSPSLLVASSTSSSILCNGGGSIVNVSAQGGTLPYLGIGDYLANAGNHSYTITDANGCKATTTVFVTEPSLLLTSSTASTILCNGDNSTVSVSAVGGTPPYSGTGIYSVNAGSYNFTVTDANGCSATTSIVVSQPSLLNVNGSSDVTVFLGYTPMACTTITATSNNGGTGGIGFSWSNGTNGQSNTVCPTTSTVYTVTATDDNGCTATDEVSVCVVNVVCYAGGSNQPKVEICHNGNSICVNPNAVASHLAHGCTLGSCSESIGCNIYAKNEELHNASSTSTIALYPNPATESLIIEFYTYESITSTKYTITNFIGQTIAEGTLNSGKNKIDISNCKNGVYYIRTEGELNFSEMFIKE